MSTIRPYNDIVSKRARDRYAQKCKKNTTHLQIAGSKSSHFSYPAGQRLSITHIADQHNGPQEKGKETNAEHARHTTPQKQVSSGYRT